MCRMEIRMHNAESLSAGQIEEFLAGTSELEIEAVEGADVYSWIKRVLVGQDYHRQGKKGRGRLRRYIMGVSGRSRAQVNRLIRQYRDNGEIVRKGSGRRRFAKRYTDADVRLLAETDRAHVRLSGPATRHLLKRGWTVYRDARYERLAEISVSHLYNLRGGALYRKCAADYRGTQPSAISIGERRKPEPLGRPGYLRIDSVHQGDWDGAKGVYHINAVDEVTQWQVVGCTERLSEAYLIPVLEALLHQFPFRVLGFHADNGSEYVNHHVARMLEKMLAEFTRSRPCRSQDNALVEGKNGAVIRKHIGYGHIPGEHAEAVQKFYAAHFNPYLNFHRPCGFATVDLDHKGKRRRRYPHQDYATPYEKFRGLEGAAEYLKPGITMAALDVRAGSVSDTDAGRNMNAAKAKLLARCKIESPRRPEPQ